MDGASRRVAIMMRVAAIAAGVVLVLPAARASAMGAMTARLSIRDVPKHICGQLICSARWDLTVDATIPLSPGERPNLAGHRIAMRVWGDDPFSDDLLIGPVYIPYQDRGAASGPYCPLDSDDAPADRPADLQVFYATASALRIRGCLRDFRSNSSRPLNEDDAPLDRGDEIYVGVRLLNPQGTTVRSDETNRAYGRF